ncbi:hypothetical protein QJQ45_026196, partial [Haematococcus lacustris]
WPPPPATSHAPDQRDTHAAAASAPAALEFLVKWRGRSHTHNEWVRGEGVAALAPARLARFLAKHPLAAGPCCRQQESWTLPGRLLGRRRCPSGPGWEVLVQWQGLGAEHASWEPEGQGVLVHPSSLALFQRMWQINARALARATPLLQQPSAAAPGPPPAAHPSRVGGVGAAGGGGLRGRLGARQVQLGGPPGRCSSPPEFNVLVYSGSAAAGRAVMLEWELWLDPASADKQVQGGVGGADSSMAAGSGRAFKPDLVLASLEAVVRDLPTFRTVRWEVVVTDMRQRFGTAQLSSTHAALADLASRQRLLLLSAPPWALTPQEDLLALVAAYALPSPAAAFASAPLLQLQDVLQGGEQEAAALDPAGVCRQLHALLQPCSWLGPAPTQALAGAPHRQRGVVEALLPVQLSAQQVCAYRTVLASHYQVLEGSRPV